MKSAILAIRIIGDATSAVAAMDKAQRASMSFKDKVGKASVAASAALAAIGVTALIWLAASLLLWRERPVDAVYLVRVSGDGTGLDVTLRRLAQSRRLPVLLVDCGLTDEGRRAAALLSDMNTKLLTPQELAAYYTEEDTTEQGR